jgi:predicted MPP superfamily phosphohydrolase
VRVPSKRRVFWLGLLAAVLLSLGWAAGIEPGLLRLRSEELTSPYWPPTQPKLRIVFIADLHVGAPHVPASRVDKIVAMANAAEPDLVLLGGDFTAHVLGGRSISYDAIARSLAALRARHGIYAVMGNHDHWDGNLGGLKSRLQEAGIVVLENEARRIAVPGGHVWLVGMDDPYTGHANPNAAFRGVPFTSPMAEPVIVLAHDPSVFTMAPREVALIAAGHTHGGQVRIPFVGAIVNASPAPPRRHPRAWKAHVCDRRHRHEHPADSLQLPARVRNFDNWRRAPKKVKSRALSEQEQGRGEQRVRHPQQHQSAPRGFPGQ